MVAIGADREERERQLTAAGDDAKPEAQRQHSSTAPIIAVKDGLVTPGCSEGINVIPTRF